MNFIKYKQVARITLYGFDDLLRSDPNSVFTESLSSRYFIGTCARRRQLGWFVSGLPWGLEPHDIPIGEQWGGR
jgi:hypothetical protein